MELYRAGENPAGDQAGKKEEQDARKITTFTHQQVTYRKRWGIGKSKKVPAMW